MKLNLVLALLFYVITLVLALLQIIFRKIDDLTLLPLVVISVAVAIYFSYRLDKEMKKGE